MAMISGKKTYLTGAAMILSGLGLLAKEFNDGSGFSQEGLFMVLTGLGFIFNRQAVAKVEKQVGE